jgi:hypothetical protein
MRDLLATHDQTAVFCPYADRFAAYLTRQVKFFLRYAVLSKR